MFYTFLYPLAPKLLNLLKYQTFRTGAAIMTALFICLFLGPFVIRFLRGKSGQPIRSCGPETHLKKQGTPTMGGVLILFSLFVSVFLWGDLKNTYIWILLFTTASLGLLGFIDDYLKIIKKNSAGVSFSKKMFWQTLIALISVYWITSVSGSPIATGLIFPFFKNFVLELGFFYLILGAIVIVGSSNAVNLTDGLDGLVSVPLIMANLVFIVIAYLAGNVIFSNYLQIHYVSGIGEMAIFGGAVIGAVLGFLWYNAPPAQIFMGDTGSLALGGALGAMAVATKHEIVLVIVGGLFVAEALSDIIQVASYKLRGKRVFKMAPIHHHFEKSGWPETRVVVRFWIISIILALLGLSTLKIR
ncbi:MAG: phospho-N-acetylmuramoyl-pentapeptide-transferase [Alphaproteobacteria bacterium]|nr:phospho-N-acetylmuramoyl-pentapeptide-transferase [Alphaproteobacteria bacterium]